LGRLRRAETCGGARNSVWLTILLPLSGWGRCRITIVGRARCLSRGGNESHGYR
jgi:hypothetical protein